MFIGSSIFWTVTPHGLLKVKDVSEKHIVVILRIEEQPEDEAGK
jgi:hypothetical protein